MLGFTVEIDAVNIILTLVSAGLGILLFCCGVLILNKVPAEWLCDYDEKPSEEMLNGKRFGGTFLYLAGSILTALAFAITYLVYGLSIYTLIIMATLFVLIMIILSDGKYYIIPDQFVIIAGVLSAVFAYYDLFAEKRVITSWWSPIVGGVGVALMIIIVNLLTTLIAKKDGMGFGDVKLFGAIGIAVGFPNVLIALLLAVITAFVIIIVTVVVNVLRKKETYNYIPFGPSICIGVLSIIILNEPISYLISLYLSLF